MLRTPRSAQAQQLADGVVSVTTAPDVATVLCRLVEAATRLVAARRGELLPTSSDDSRTSGAALKVPVLAHGRPWLWLALTDREDGGVFTAEDAHLIASLTAAAQVGIDCHCLRHHRDEMEDSIVQRLFATGLGLHHAASVLEGHPDARRPVERAIDDLDETARLVNDGGTAATCRAAVSSSPEIGSRHDRFVARNPRGTR